VFESNISAGAPDAIAAIGAIASTTSQSFAPHLARAMPLIQTAMRMTDDIDLCTAGIGALVDVSKGVDGAALAPHVAGLVTQLTAMLTDQAVNKDVKPVALGALGDVAFNVGPAFHPHLASAMTLILQASDIAVDPKNAEYVEWQQDLRINALEAASCIIQGYGVENAAGISPYVPSLIQKVQMFAKDLAKKRPAAANGGAGAEEEAEEEDLNPMYPRRMAELL
jgi:importin subunit beta-1